MKFQFFHKIAVTHEKFLVLFNLQPGPDITHSRDDDTCGLHNAHPWFTR